MYKRGTNYRKSEKKPLEMYTGIIKIAKYLSLESLSNYIGHIFRRTLATFFSRK